MALLTLIIFTFSVFGVFLTRRNLILILISIELLLLSVVMNFIFASVALDDIIGQIFSILILTIAAAESAIGLALVVITHRLHGVISLNRLSKLKS